MHLLKKQLKIVVTVVMLAAVLMAVWLFISPSLEQQRRAEHQAALLESITSGDGTITVNESFATGEVDYYDDGLDACILQYKSVEKSNEKV